MRTVTHQHIHISKQELDSTLRERLGIGQSKAVKTSIEIVKDGLIVNVIHSNDQKIEEVRP